MSKRLSATVLAIVMLLGLVVLSASGCCPLLQSATESEPVATETQEPGVIESPTLDEWARADTRTGTYELTTVYPDGESRFQTGEFWIEGNLVRYDLYEDGELIRSILTPDGVNAYFAQHGEQICEPSVVDGPYYLRSFSVPSKKAVEDGIDEETGAVRMKYVVQETYDITGSANKWYSEDVTYLLIDGEVVGIISRGCVPDDDGTIGDLQVSRRIFTDIEVGGEVPEGTFDLPYPIQEAD